MLTTLCYCVQIASVPAYQLGDPEHGPAWLDHSGRAEDGVHLRRWDHAAGQGWVLAVNGSAYHPDVRGPRRLTPGAFKVGKDWNRTLRAYCRQHGLVATGLPGWHLMREGGR